jgi:hypothetical protein
MTAMNDYGAFHAERARRKALLERGDEPDSIAPWPLDVWHHESEELVDVFVAQGPQGEEVCRVEFWYNPREHDGSCEPNAEGELPETLVEVTLPDEEPRKVFLYEATQEEWDALGKRDRFVALWDARNVHLGHHRDFLSMTEAIKRKVGPEKFQEMLDDPDPRYDGFREAVADATRMAEEKSGN